MTSPHAIHHQNNMDEAELLHAAVYSLDVTLVQSLLEQGVNPNLHNKEGKTPLMKTMDAVADKYGTKSNNNDIVNNAISIVHFLVQHGADVNGVSLEQTKQSALHLAATQGQIKIVNTLLKHGANLEIQDAFGNTPLIAAITGTWAIKNITTTVQGLLHAGANPTVSNINGHTPLHLWAKKSKREPELTTARMLLEKGALINVADGVNHQTPLFVACSYDDVRTVKLFLENGADPRCQDKHGNTALHLVSGDLNQHTVSIARQLIQHGADPEATNHQNETPLFFAVKRRNSALVALLLPLQRDLQQCNHLGISLLDDLKGTNLETVLREEMIRREQQSLCKEKNPEIYSSATSSRLRL